MKRLVSLILLASLLVCQAVGCSKPAEESEKPQTGSTQSQTENPADGQEPEPEETVDPRLAVSDDLPDKTFDGKSLKIASEPHVCYEIVSEELTGENTNDIIYNRNLNIEKRFEAKIESVPVGDAANSAMMTAAAGTRDFDVISLINYKSGSAIANQSFDNWYDIPCVDLTKPWWCTLINSNCTINGKAYTITGDLAVTALTYTIAMFFDQKVCEDWGYSADSLYKKVYDNEWTIDKFTAMVDGIYTDNNGNGEKDKDDTFGIGTNRCDTIDVWLSAFDQPVTGRDEDGFMTIALVDEKTVNVLEKLIALLNRSPGAFLQYAETWDERNYFKQDRLAFCPLSFNECFSTLREMESAYGILPMPKYDAAQQNYLTTLIDEVSMFGVMRPVPEDELEFVGILFTALNAESYREVYPVYYDVALKNKYSEDPETAKMIDLIMDGRTFDLGFTFGVSYLSRFPYCIRDLVQQGSTDIASTFAAMQGMLDSGLAIINGVYQ